MTEQELANVIWDIKEIIRNLYDDAEVEDVILPFTAHPINQGENSLIL